MSRLFTEAAIEFDESVGGAAILDLGCADGDLAFWIGSLGFEVDAVDFAGTNFNGMRGIRTLASALESRVRIFERDLDALAGLPRERYGLCVALGLLYHLKNPFYLVETLARHVDYCILSTRITDKVPGVRGTLTKVPIAYLVDREECNSDATNFWIFSRAGLERLLARSGWIIRSSLITGYKGAGEPARSDRDKRFFCLLQNEALNPWRGVKLEYGWHSLEEGRFRWTERRFGLRTPGPGRIIVKVYVSEQHLDLVDSVVLAVNVNGRPSKPVVFDQPGVHVVRLEVTVEAQVEFETSMIMPPDAVDGRERGIVVSSVDFWPLAASGALHTL